MSEKEIVTTGMPVPVCPHCGHANNDWWDGIEDALDGDGDETEMDCPSCEKPYLVTIHRDYYFDTEVPDAR